MALHAGELMSTDRLVDELWGESPPKAVLSSLQNLVSELRKQLGRELLITQAPGYLLDLERDKVDVHRFGRSWRTVERRQIEREPPRAYGRRSRSGAGGRSPTSPSSRSRCSSP